MEKKENNDIKIQKIQISGNRLSSLLIFVLLIMITSFSVDNWIYIGDFQNNRVKIYRIIIIIQMVNRSGSSFQIFTQLIIKLTEI